MPGGSIQGMIAACDKVTYLLPGDVKVIPGHGDAVDTSETCADYSVMLKETSAAVQAAINLKKTPAADEDGEDTGSVGREVSGKFINSDLFIETLYNSLTNNKNAEYLKHN